MALRFEHILTEGIAQLSYLVGDDSAGVAAVIDPRRDVNIYLDTARRMNLAVTHVFETHNHADFVSGARELAARTGAVVCLSREGGAEYGYAHQSVHDGETFAFGSVIMKAHHTPGHTPEHMAYSLAETDRSGSPWGILTGDSLFVDSVGRPDLMGEKSEELVRQLHDTIYRFYLELDDGVILYPCHGLGSACGPKIGDRLSSTIGYERRYNPYLQGLSRQDFKKKIMEAAPPAPAYYSRTKKENARGPEILGAGPVVPGLIAQRFLEASQNPDTVVLDTRQMLAFGGGHIEGALNIGARPELSLWAGWMLDPEAPLLLVLDRDRDLPDVLPLLIRTGYTRFAGYLVGGMTAWENAGLPMQRLPQETVQELHRDSKETQLLDVRTPEEWKKGHIPGARHQFVPDLREHLNEINKDRPVVTYCDSGYRSNIAASLLQSQGFEDVRSVPGSWQAWKHAGYEIAPDDH